MSDLLNRFPIIFLAPFAAEETVPVILAFIARPIAGEEGCCPAAY